MATERYILNIINSFHGKEPVKEKFNTFDTINEIRKLWEDRVISAIQSMALMGHNENFANPSDKDDILFIIYTVLISLIIGFLIAVFIVAASSFNMSWCYNKALGNSDLETSYWATLCFVFFILYFPYYGIILQPLCIKSKDSMTSVIASYINPIVEIGLPTWKWIFAGVFNEKRDD